MMKTASRDPATPTLSPRDLSLVEIGSCEGAAAPLPLLGARDAPAVRVGLPPDNVVAVATVDGPGVLIQARMSLPRWLLCAKWRGGTSCGHLNCAPRYRK
ncbi:hypothetical protein Psuf_058250 [Phytohabitans suffuscus]|uniref:Uncharacterized protein n=1 Tax=Phytohabitans suffuscus TaxID=624315 RepID=A0A6F8YQZ1_9ACTN|nr:hypothetical protein Psuf_058250 [Phytohabitans suffuscus]